MAISADLNFPSITKIAYDQDVTHAKKSTLQNVLQIVIFCAAAILAIVVVYNLINYSQISFLWKVAISTFIIILPISFFLQAKFLEKSHLNTEISYLKSQFYTMYQSKKESIRLEIEKVSISDSGSRYFLNENSKFLDVFRAVINIIENDILREYYALIFEKLISKKYYPDGGFFSIKDPDTLSDEYHQMQSRSKQIEVELLKYSSVNLDSKAIEERDRLRAELSDLNKDISDLKPNIDKIDDHKDQDRKKFVQFIFGNELKEIISERMREEGIDFNAYILPLSFFTFIYFAGILITLPLINSVFTGIWDNPHIPLFDEKKLVIPFDVIQWGFIGGLVYTSINLLNRFFRMDLQPKVYLSSSFRLIFAIVAAIIIDFLYIIANYDMGKVGEEYIATIPPYVLLSCFVIGIAPIQFLIRVGQSTALKLMEWTARKSAGNDSVTVIDGINLIVSERLGEGGIDSIQQLAFSKPDTLSRDTKFDIMTICDWKDQALLYLCTGNVKLDNFEMLSEQSKSATDQSKSATDQSKSAIDQSKSAIDQSKSAIDQSKSAIDQSRSATDQSRSATDQSNFASNRSKSLVLHKILVQRLGIRTFSGLKARWNEVKVDPNLSNAFFNELGIKDENGNIRSLVTLFESITSYDDEYIKIMNQVRSEKSRKSLLQKLIGR